MTDGPIVHSKMLSSFSNLHDIQNLNDFLYFFGTQKKCNYSIHLILQLVISLTTKYILFLFKLCAQYI